MTRGQTGPELQGRGPAPFYTDSPIFSVQAQVVTERVDSSSTAWRSSEGVPTFYLQCDSQATAEHLARVILPKVEDVLCVGRRVVAVHLVVVAL